MDACVLTPLFLFAAVFVGGGLLLGYNSDWPAAGDGPGGGTGGAAGCGAGQVPPRVPPRTGAQCRGCGKVYSQRASLYRHLKYECGKEPQFHCPFCPHRAKQKSSLTTHIRMLHTSQAAHLAAHAQTAQAQSRPR